MIKWRFCLGLLFASVGLLYPRGEVVKRGPHYNLHQVISRDQAGAPKTNEWVELQGGLNFLKANGEYAPSSSGIDLDQNGGAVFSNGPFKVRFRPDYSDEKGLQITFPDGKALKIQTVGIALTDLGTGESVWIGELKSAQGFLVSSNEISYPDAFKGIRADINVSIGLGRFQHDICLKEMPINPQLLGIDPARCRLEIWHRIIDGPMPQRKASSIRRADGAVDIDERLDFGEMLIGQGDAFLVGTNRSALSDSEAQEASGFEHRIPVAKELYRSNPNAPLYLIESVPYAESLPKLRALPVQRQTYFDADALKRRAESAHPTVSSGRKANPISLAATDLDTPKIVEGRKIASITRSELAVEPGFLMDYTVVTTTSNFRFAGNRTYHVVGTVALSGTTVIEGGAVIKYGPYTTTNTPYVVPYGPLVCETSPMAPAIFTAETDNTVGEVINTNQISGRYGWCLSYTADYPLDLHDLHFRYANYGITLGNTNIKTLSNIQAVECTYPILSTSTNVYVRNYLAYKCRFPLYGYNAIIRAEHVTEHYADEVFYSSGGNSSLFITNSLAVCIAYSSTGVTSDHLITLPSDEGVFQSVKAGAHYLAKSSPYRRAGTAVSSETRAVLKGMTTYAPIELKDSITVDTTLSPRIPRDGSSEMLSLGYHYPALDYMASSLVVNNAKLILTNGVAIGGYGPILFKLQGSGEVISCGQPDQLNRLVTFEGVQEQPMGLITNNYFLFFTGFAANVRFTYLSTIGGTSFWRGLIPGGEYDGTFTLRDSVLRNVTFILVADEEQNLSPTADFRNNIIERCGFTFEQSGDPPSWLEVTLRNNLFLRSALTLSHFGQDLGEYDVRDNLFDNCSLYLYEQDVPPYEAGGGPILAGNNAYTSATATFGGSNNKTSINPAYVKGPLGRYYYPSTGPANSLADLIDAGSATDAALAGLFHYTTLTNTVEWNTPLDIGFHYPALGADVKLLDSDLDGLADLIEDANQNGIQDGTETSFLNPDTDGDGENDRDERKRGTDPLQGDFTIAKRLGYWSFDDPEFIADTGQAPVNRTDAAGGSASPAFLGSAADLTTSTSRLIYREVDLDGHANLTRTRGTVRFWFRPDWVPTPNTSPANMPDGGRLISLGGYTAEKQNWWALNILPNGTRIEFVCHAPVNGVGQELKIGWDLDISSDPNLTWAASRWHQIALVYDDQDTAEQNPYTRLYVDNQLRAEGSWAPICPSPDVRIVDRLAISSGKDGSAKAKGHFDEIETFNYPLTPEQLTFDYEAALNRDDDNDGLSNLIEVEQSGSNLADADSDDDGMPDGWEYWWTKHRPAGASPFDLLADDASGQFEVGESDSYQNLDEYRLGLNPYRSDNIPLSIPLYKADAQNRLLNIDFGEWGSMTALGVAGTGFDQTDQWNKVGVPQDDEPILLNWADGSATGVKMRLRMYLGHVTRYTVSCETVVEPPDPPPPPVNYCDWLSLSNSIPWQDIFCCSNVSGNLAALQSTYYCIHSESGEKMYLYQSDQGPKVWDSSAGYRGLFRALTPQWPWDANLKFGGVPYFSAFSPSGEPVTTINGNFHESQDGNGNVIYDQSGNPTFVPTEAAAVTTVNAFITPAKFFTDLRPPVNQPPPPPPATHTVRKVISVPWMENAWIRGFDQAAYMNGATGIAATDIMNDFLWNSKDGLTVNTPQGVECDQFWFAGDGHASIDIENLPPGRYAVYLYAVGKYTGPCDPISGCAAQSTPVSVNGQLVAIPGAGRDLTTFVPGVNFETTVVGSPAQQTFLPVNGLVSSSGFSSAGDGSVTSISIDFKDNQSVINALQLVRLAEFANIQSITATYDGANGIRVNWSAPPGFSYRLYRVIPGLPERRLSTYSGSGSFFDNSFPVDVQIRYRIVAVSPFDVERGYALSDPVEVDGVEWHAGKHAPTMHHIDPLKFTYKDSPFVLSAAAVRAQSDAFDFDGDPICYEVVKVLSGTLSVSGTTTAYGPDDSLPETPLVIGRDALTWTPPSGLFGPSVRALVVRATDGAMKSPDVVELPIEVRDTAVLMWWGQAVYGMVGNGQTTDWRGWYPVNGWLKPFTDPSVTLMKEGQEVPAGSDRRLVNIVQLAVNGAAGYGNGARAALKSDGTVWTWGNGKWGELGDGQYSDPDAPSGYVIQPGTLKYMTPEATMPIRVPSLTGIRGIAGGWNHFLAVKWDGTVWAWGMGANGELGVDPERIPARANRKYSVLDDYWADGIRARSDPQLVKGLSRIAQVYAGYSMSFAVSEDGELYLWGAWAGEGHSGEAWSPYRIDIPGRVVQVVVPSSGAFLALNDQGEVYGWGDSSRFAFGRTFPAEQTFQTVPVKVPIEPVQYLAGSRGHLVAVLADGSVKEWGSFWWGIKGPPEPIRGLQNIVKIATSGKAVLALDASGRVFGRGDNWDGVLGQEINVTPEERERADELAGNPATRLQAEALWGSPKFGVYRQPIELDSLEAAENVDLGIEAAFAVAPMQNFAPRALRASGLDGSVLLSWRRMSGASSYEVHRGRSADSMYYLASISDNPDLSRQIWSDTEVQNGITYLYKVRAIIRGEPTPFSFDAKATPNTAPPQITDLGAEALSRQAHIYWKALPGDVEYEVWRSVDGGGFQQLSRSFPQPAAGIIPFCGGGQSTMKMAEAWDIRLDPAKSYSYQVRAKNAAGYGPFSDPVTISDTALSAQTITVTGFEGVQDPLVVDAQSKSATVSWTSRTGIPAGAQFYITLSEYFGGSEWNGTELVRTLTKGPPRFLGVIDAKSENENENLLNAFTFSTFPGHKYEVCVSECDPCSAGSNAGEWNSVCLTFDAPVASGLEPPVFVYGPPTGPNEELNSDCVYFRWRGNAVNYMVSLLRKVNGEYVDAKNDCGLPPATIPLFDLVEPDENGVAEYIQGGLEQGEYKLELHSIGQDFAGSLSEPDVYLFKISGVGTAIPDLNVKIADNRLRVTWWGEDAEAWVAVEQYRGWRFILQRHGPEQSACPAWVTVYDGSQLGVEDGEVKNSQNYKYRLFGIGPDMQAGWSETANAATPTPTFAATADLDFEAAGRNSAVELTWAKLSGVDSVEVDEYELRGSSTPGSDQPIIAVIPKGILPSYRYVDLNVVNGIKYYYQLIARKKNGDAFGSPLADATPTAAGDPIAPTSITSEVIGGKVNLAWSESPGAEYYTVNGVPTRSPAHSVALDTSSTPHRNNFTIAAHRRGHSSSVMFTVLAWGVSGSIPPTQFEIRRRNSPTSEELLVATLPAEARDYGEVCPTETATYTVTPVGGGEIVEWNNQLYTFPEGQLAISLNELPDQVVSPTNLVVSVVIDKASFSDYVQGMNLDLTGINVEFIVDGVVVATDNTIPYEFVWVNPTRTIGSAHQVKARLVHYGTTTAETLTKSVSVSVVPELQKFRTTVTDLQLPAPGLPLAVSRNYDSQVISQGMLGKGWRFEWESSKMVVSRLSKGWLGGLLKSEFTRDGDTGEVDARGDIFTINPTQPHLIEVHLPDRSVQTFYPKTSDERQSSLEADASGGIVLTRRLFFLPVLGSMGSLGESPEVTPLTRVSVEYFEPPWVLTREDESDPFVPRNFTYTNAAGVKMKFSSESAEFGGDPLRMDLPWVESKDEFGNTITRTATTDGFKFEHSNGRAIVLKKVDTTPPNSSNYRWEVYDPLGLGQNDVPSGPPVTKYFIAGNLLTEVHSLVDRAGNGGAGVYVVTRYEYDGDRLVRATTPSGILAFENGYDANGLLASQMDALGLRKSMTIPPGSDIKVNVVDNVENEGEIAIPEASYGPGGELVAVKSDKDDPNSAVAIGYDALGRVSYQLDQEGNYTSIGYDSDSDRVASVVDGNGNQTSSTYTVDGKLESVVDGRGNATRYVYYDAPSGEAPNDLVTPYNPKSSLQCETDADGNSTFYTYNKLGQPLLVQKVQGQGGVPIATRYEYDTKGNLTRVKEPLWPGGESLSYVTDYEYDANGNRTKEIRRRSVVNRDQNGIFVSSTPTMVQTIETEFVYDAQNRLIKTSVPRPVQTPSAPQEWTGTLLNSNGQASQSTNNLGQITKYTYDPRGNLIETKYPDGSVSRVVYDARGRQTWSQERAFPDYDEYTVAPATETIYDSQGRVIRVVRHANTSIQKMSLENVTPGAGVNPNQYFYTLASATSWEPQFINILDAVGTTVSFTRTEYDNAGRVKYSVNESGNVQKFEYDAAGRRTGIIHYLDYVVPNPIATSAINPPGNASVTEMHYGFDENGNQAWIEDGNGQRTDFVYDRLNRQRAVIYPKVTGDADRKRTQTVYDGLGNRTQQIDEAGVVTAFSYDALGRLTNVINDFKVIYGPGEAPLATGYEYDEAGNLRTELRFAFAPIDPDGPTAQGLDPVLVVEETSVTSYEYDVLGRRTRRFLPGASLDDVTSNRGMEKTVYSKQGPTGGPWTARKEATDFRGLTIQYDYDSMDRLVMKILPAVNAFENVRTQSWFYDGPLLTKAIETGTLLTGGNRTNFYAYDASRRLRKKDTPEAVLTYTYAPGGQIGSISIWRRSSVGENAEPDGSSTNNATLAYTYDALGRLNGVADTVGINSWSASYAYDGAGNIDKVVGPYITHDYSYNERNQLTEALIKTTSGGTMRRKYVYTLNSTGRRTSATDWDLNAGVDRVRRTVKYAYDQNSERQGIVPRLNRLAHEDIVDNIGSLGGSISHAYDLRSNQSQVESSVSSLSDWTGSFSLRDEMTDISGSTQTYDANGNLIQGNGFNNYFDAENRLIRRATATVTNILAYDFEGNRVWKLSTTNDSSGTYYSRWIYVFDDKNPTGYAQSLAEYWHYSFVGTSTNWTPASWMFHKSYAYGNGPLWLTHYNGGAQHGRLAYGMDGHGSVRALFSGANVFTSYEYDYDAYGNLLNTPGEVYHSMIRYAGEYWDWDLREYYLRSRQFDPRYGRFTTSDSFEGSPSDPLSLHKYLYCSADPVNRIDPSGRSDYQAVSVTTGSSIGGVISSQLSAAIARANVSAMINITRLVANADKVLFYAEATMAGIMLLDHGVALANRVADRLQNNKSAIPMGNFSYGPMLERSGLSSESGYLGGTVSKIDYFEKGLGVSFKAHGLSPAAPNLEGRLLDAIQRDLQTVKEAKTAGVQGIDWQQKRIDIPARNIQQTMLIVAVPETQASTLVRQTFRQALVSLENFYDTFVEIVPVRQWRVK